MRLLVRPEAGSYQLSFPETNIRVKLDGGRSRVRRDVLNGAREVEMTWILDPDGYDYLLAFYRKETREGSLPFTMMLIVEEASTEVECVCQLTSPLKLSAQSGLAYTVSATVEVEAPFNEDQDEDDDAIIDAYNTAQGYTP
jgi:hypothetical protein